MPSTGSFQRPRAPFAKHGSPGPTVRLGLIDPRLVGVGDAKGGLCGGMSWLVRERFEAGSAIPDVCGSREGSPLFRAIVRRQILSLDWLRVPLRFWLRRDGAGRAGAPDARGRVAAHPSGDRRRGLAMVGLIRHHSWNPM